MTKRSKKTLRKWITKTNLPVTRVVLSPKGLRDLPVGTTVVDEHQETYIQSDRGTWSNPLLGTDITLKSTSLLYPLVVTFVPGKDIVREAWLNGRKKERAVKKKAQK